MSQGLLSAISAYLCVLCVKVSRGEIFNAEDAEIRRDRSEGKLS